MSVRRRRVEEGLYEAERYELDEPPRYEFESAEPFTLERRSFIAVLGAGLLISTRGGAVGQERPRRGRGGGRGEESIADRLHIGTDGVITVLTGKVEVGQGSRTQITMAAAEELGVPVESIRLIMADSAVVPNDGSSAGSRTTPSTIPRVRRACAAARDLLIETAAKHWQVDPKDVSIVDGFLVGPRSDQNSSIASVVAEHFTEGFERSPARDTSVRSVSEWKVLGTPVPKVTGKDIVTGAHRYPSDIVRPDMLHGVILRPPSYSATLASIDLSSAKEIAGVTVVHDGDFVGFAAPTSAAARQARDAAAKSAKWNEQASHPSSDDLFERLRSDERASGGGGRGGGRGGRERGSVEPVLEAAATALRATYTVAYIQHAPMEPRAAVAEWNDASLTVWTGTQNPDRVRSQLAESFRISSDRVRVIVPDTGGAFGGKHTGEAALEAARLARAAGRPVSLRWTREEEFTWAYFRPAGVIDLAAGLDANGRLIAWEQTNYNSGGSAVETPYAIPNTRSGSRSGDAPLRQGSYRALASTANVFARESFMDELAAKADVDPLEFRLRQLEEPRLRAVLEAAAERFGWARRREATKGSRERGIGLACGTEKSSVTAACVEIEVDHENGRYRVVEICQAFECGAIQNPKNLEAQVAGCIIQGLGAALREEIRFKDGRITNASFARYRVPRFRDVPRIDIALLDRKDAESVGAGETPIIAVAPAIGNALFAATGARLRSLPLRSEEWRSV